MGLQDGRLSTDPLLTTTCLVLQQTGTGCATSHGRLPSLAADVFVGYLRWPQHDPTLTEDHIEAPPFDPDQAVKDTPEGDIRAWAEKYHKGGGGDAVMNWLNVVKDQEGIKWGDINEDDDQERTVFGGALAMVCPFVTFEKVFKEIGDAHVKLLEKMMKKHGVGPGGLVQKSEVRRVDQKLQGPCDTWLDSTDHIEAPPFDPDQAVKDTPEGDIRAWAEKYHKGGGGDAVMNWLNVVKDQEGIKWGDINEDDDQERTVFGGALAMVCPFVTFEKVFKEIGDAHVKLLEKMMKKHGVGPGGLVQKSEVRRVDQKLQGPCDTWLDSTDHIEAPPFDPDQAVKDTPEGDIRAWAEKYHKGGGGDAVMNWLNVVKDQEGIKWGDINEDDDQERTVFGGALAMVCPFVTFEKVFKEIGDAHVKLLEKMMKKHGVGPGGLVQK
eukprot:Skav205145  [mRNA]  locus=scaffold593:64071:68183:- [translate_table: standard]